MYSTCIDEPYQDLHSGQASCPNQHHIVDAGGSQKKYFKSAASSPQKDFVYFLLLYQTFLKVLLKGLLLSFTNGNSLGRFWKLLNTLY